MISALVTNSESVQLDKVNRKVYKFQTLVFEEGSQVQGTSFISTSKESSAQPSKTGWKCAYGEYLHNVKGSQAGKEKVLHQNPPHSPARKRSKAALELGTEYQAFSQETTVIKSAHFPHEEAAVCSSCHQVLLDESDAKWSSLMEKSKEELVAMVINLQGTQPIRERKKGYCPTDDEMVHLNEMSQECTDSREASLQTTVTRRRLSIENQQQ